MNRKELKALITLAGRVDPSLQTAMLQASKQSGEAAKGVKGLMAQAAKIGPGFSKALGSVSKGFQATLGAAKKFAAATGIVAGVAVAALAPLASQGLQYASDLQEVQNVVDTTFVQSASVIDDFAKTSLEAYGLTSLQAKNYSSVLGAMYKSMGLSSDQVLVMSQNMTALAGDMASFYNLDPEEAFEKIRSGVSGETEPLKQLGINMSVANMQAYALSQGISKGYSSMSQSEQALLRYSYLLSVTSDAQGDFAKTSGSFANQQKLLKANLQQVSGEVMQRMLPTLAAGMVEVNKFIGSLDPDALGAFAGQAANMAISFLPLISEVLPAFGELLMMILPPLLQIGEQLMPIVVLGIKTLMEAVSPLIPVFTQFVEAILPPIAEILTAIMPLVSNLADLVATILGPALKSIATFLSNIAKLVSIVAKPLAGIVKNNAEFYKSGGASATVAPENRGSSSVYMGLNAYANGGFASAPSIFGEAGLEAAIPIRPGNARSLSLFAKTAQLLGIGSDANDAGGTNDMGFFGRGLRIFGTAMSGGGDRQLVSFTYAPVFQGGGQPPENLLKRNSQDIRRMLDDYFGDKGRLAWE